MGLHFRSSIGRAPARLVPFCWPDRVEQALWRTET
jgi:hypothetical protein